MRFMLMGSGSLFMQKMRDIINREEVRLNWVRDPSVVALELKGFGVTFGHP